MAGAFYKRSKCISMECCYNTDLDGLEMSNVIKMPNATRENADVKLKIPEDVLLFIVQCGDDVLPNVRGGFQIFITVATSIASYKQSLIRLKLILSYQKLSMGHEKFSALALTSVKRAVAGIIKMEKTLDELAAAKARGIPL